MRPGFRDSWPVLALRVGAVAGGVGMVAGQVAQGATWGQVGFTVVFAALFVGAVWLVANGASRRLRQAGEARIPRQEPRKLALVGLMTIAIIMWLIAAYGVFIAAITDRPQNDWHALAYAGVAICATGATFLVRQARLAWADHYLRGWPEAL